MSIQGRNIAGASSEMYGRVDNDFYATPPESTKSLIKNYDFDSVKSFYDPCCGQGHIIKVIEKYYPNADFYASDIVNRGFGISGIDFLKFPPDRLPIPDNGVDWVITNPPYSHALDFIEKSLVITNKGVAMFLKIQFLESKSRKSFFKRSPLKYVYVFSERQNPYRNGLPYNPKTGKKWQSTICFAWFIWEHGYDGEPVIRWI